MRTAFVLKSKVNGKIYGRAFKHGEENPRVWLAREVRWAQNYDLLHSEVAGPQDLCCDTWARNWVEQREACPFEIGRCYKLADGIEIRKVVGIDFDNDRIRTAEWSRSRGEWRESGNAYRNLKGEWIAPGASHQVLNLLPTEVPDPKTGVIAPRVVMEDGQIKSISITSAGSGYRGRPGIHDSVVIDEVIDSAGFALEDPSARRDREHVAVARIGERTPYAHHPDLKGWTMDSSTSTRDFGILHKTEILE